MEYMYDRQLRMYLVEQTSEGDNLTRLRAVALALRFPPSTICDMPYYNYGMIRIM